jgi:hypothetical protein
MSKRENGRGLFLGGGERPDYLALLLFVAGCLLGMVAVYNNIRRVRYALPLALGLLCTLAGVGLVAARREERE